MRLKVFLFVYIISIVVTWYLTGSYIRNKDVFEAAICGTVDALRATGRGNYCFQIKFRNTKEFSSLASVCMDNQKDLEKGDSIFKPMHSYNYLVYKKDSLNHYKFHKILINPYLAK
jgi:hypothetical protein